MSIFIILGLVVMWGALLLPMWLRRHDDADEARSVDRFSTAMHTLSRREGRGADDRSVVMPHRTRDLDVHVSGASAPAATSSRPALTAAQRRRRALTALLGITILSFGAAVLVGGAILWVAQVLIDCCLAAFLAHLRTQAKRAAERRRAARLESRA
ncbi:MAG TPA: hypothetical protein VG708_03960, partial [Mycobacteriales bacterium]|nr:hypothetical protein [Mycobacteriales bacterium]